MKHFWPDLEVKTDKPWLILGKGPSFSCVYDTDLSRYYTLGLNHVNNIVSCTLALIIDLEVLSSDFIEKTQKVLVPWHPHINFRPSKITLKELLCTNYYLEYLENSDRLYTYDLSTWRRFDNGIKYKNHRPIISAKYFSSEAAFGILINKGVKEIYSLGLDGGKEYAREFKHIKPLTNGRKNFDYQFIEINKLVEKHKITYQAL
jgi:hypothetical protein